MNAKSSQTFSLQLDNKMLTMFCKFDLVIFFPDLDISITRWVQHTQVYPLSTNLTVHVDSMYRLKMPKVSLFDVVFVLFPLNELNRNLPLQVAPCNFLITIVTRFLATTPHSPILLTVVTPLHSESITGLHTALHCLTTVNTPY